MDQGRTLGIRRGTGQWPGACRILVMIKLHNNASAFLCQENDSSMSSTSSRIIVFNLTSNWGVTIPAKAVVWNQGNCISGHMWQYLHTTGTTGEGNAAHTWCAEARGVDELLTMHGAVLHGNLLWPNMSILSRLRNLLLEWAAFNASHLYRSSWQKTNKMKKDMTLWKSKTVETIKRAVIARGLGVIARGGGELNRQWKFSTWYYNDEYMLLYIYLNPQTVQHQEWILR